MHLIAFILGLTLGSVLYAWNHPINEAVKLFLDMSAGAACYASCKWFIK